VRIEQLKQKYEIAIRWRAFPLHPDTPEEGLLLEQLFADYPVDIEGMMSRLRKTAADLGLPFGERKKTYNSRLAQELGLWAESKDKGDVFHTAAFKAYFVDGKNIAKIPVLVDLAASVELPGEEAAAVLETRAFKAAVDADWNLSREKAITAVPTFVMNQDKLVGAQPYEMLIKLMESNGVKKRKENKKFYG
jgi:predicted DsbA family dithiol-disulfide isomerase